jgi:hypothetical protein
MTDKKRGIVALWVAFALAAAMIYSTHIYADHQAYKTGVSMGKTVFNTDDILNRKCLSLRTDSFQPPCRVVDLKQDSTMEEALASANIIPALVDSTPLHAGFRDGWKEARAAGFTTR